MDKTLISVGRAALIVVIIVIVIATAWSSHENSRITRPLQVIRESDEKFKGIVAEASYGAFADTGRIVFNIKKIEKPEEITPLILFILYAGKMNDSTFKKVELQYKGKTKFVMEGDYFKRIGTQTQIDKPEKIAVEIPPLLKKPNGLPAFTEPFGDEQWVAQKQIKNLRDFLLDWYVNDWVEEKKAGLEKSSPKASPVESPSSIPTIDIDDKPGDGETMPEPSDSPTETPSESPTESPVESPSASPGGKDIPVIEPEEL